jgi:hypothetical protein
VLMAVAIIIGDDTVTLPWWWLASIVLATAIAIGANVALARLRGVGTRPCPRCCAIGVKKGLVQCPNCGFDFSTLVPQVPQPSPQQPHSPPPPQ